MEYLFLALGGLMALAGLALYLRKPKAKVVTKVVEKIVEVPVEPPAGFEPQGPVADPDDEHVMGWEKQTDKFYVCPSCGSRLKKKEKKEKS
jgi:hypothetical protein